MSGKTTNNGVSLAKGPAAIVGLILLAFGVTALIFGSHSFAAHAIHGTVNGKRWLGFEVNGWSALLCAGAGAGAALIVAAPLHWGAKTISLIVAVILGDAALLAWVDRHDALGLFAANHLTELGWAVAAGVLLIVALLPRVGGRADDDSRSERRARDERLARERTLPTSRRATAGAVNDDRHDPVDDELGRTGSSGSRRLEP